MKESKFEVLFFIKSKKTPQIPSLNFQSITQKIGKENKYKLKLYLSREKNSTISPITERAC